MDFGDLFKRGWNLVWNNKYMFALGFFAALGAGGGGGGSSNFNMPSSSSTGPSGDLPTDLPFNESDISNFFENYLGVMIGAACFLFILGIIFWLLRLSAQAGLIHAAVNETRGKGSSFGDAFSYGVSMIVNMIGLNLLAYAPTFIISILAVIVGGFAAIGAISSGDDPEAILGAMAPLFVCFVPLICISSIYNIVMTFIYPFAQRGLVIRNLGVIDSLIHGWTVLKDNFGEIFLIAIFFGLIGIGFGMVTAMVAIPVGILSLVPIFTNLESDTLSASNFILAGCGIACIGLFATAFNAVLTSYRSATVTLAYLEFTGEQTEDMLGGIDETAYGGTKPF